MDQKQLINRVIELVLDDAKSRREEAGFGGRWDDGGARSLEDQVKLYRYGQQNALPPEWKQYAEQAQRQVDPEYAEYVRLKGKFEK